mgnify:CR=1 FL=1
MFQRIHRSLRPAHSAQGGVKTARRQPGVTVQLRPTRRRNRSRHPIGVGARMTARDVVKIGQNRLAPFDRQPNKPSLYRAQPIYPFRMAGGRHMARKGRMRKDQRHQSGCNI